ncbi:hypothetical protein V7S43_009329 [Phytophthora oleae]|uniref:Uncharacterized protein n=1 Tax=Phytophthora oleae TaxID=2107226 RepID=A0ABD3FHU7_9STRA
MSKATHNPLILLSPKYKNSPSRKVTPPLTETLVRLEDYVAHRVESQLLKAVNGMMDKWQKVFQQQHLKLESNLRKSSPSV